MDSRVDDSPCWYCRMPAVAQLTIPNRTALCRTHLHGWFALLDEICLFEWCKDGQRRNRERLEGDLREEPSPLP